MDNLPNEPPNPNGNNNNPTPASPAFGVASPASPNRGEPSGVPPPQSQPSPPNPAPSGAGPHPKPHGHILTDEEKHKLSELAKQRAREHGHFARSAKLPAIIEVNQNTEPSDKKDPPLFGFFITNPVTYLKIFLKKLISRQAITLRIPVLALVIIMAGIGGFGIGFQSGINWALFRLFPNSSPLLHRAISKTGVLQKGKEGYYLRTNDKTNNLWNLKSVSANVLLEDFVGGEVQVNGNLTPTPNLIEVSEVISFTKEETPSPSPSIKTMTELPQIQTPSAPKADLPPLYSNLTWEVTQSRVLIFTSGRRKIEQEGVYLESAQINTYPVDFINYYTQSLQSKGFKETLNSKDLDGITITYSKDDLFLTFGVNNITKGSGDNKQIIGYKAYIEHN